MDAETRKRIFEPFFTTKFQGRGLGLAAVIGMVRAHRGFVRVNSQPGQGAAFRVLLPLRGETLESSEMDPPDEAAKSPWQGAGRVLVVDDDAAVRDLMRQMLEKMGYDVLVAANGVEAIDRYQQHADGIILILMDLSMPLMGGTQAFQELKRMGCTAPVILTSGYSEEQLRQEYDGTGFSGFLQKPFRRRALVAMLARALGGNGAG
jgi:CheY-like chemotaxis protein